MNIQLCILFALFYFVSTAYHAQRKITYHKVYDIECNQHNNTSNNNSTHYNIIHLIAEKTDGINDRLHYIFTAIGRPTIFLKHVFGGDSQLEINKTNICSQKGEAFKLHPNNTDISGIIIESVFPYNDSSDSVSLKGLDYVYDVGEDVARHFTWEYKPSKDISNGKVMFKGTSKRYNDSSLDFSVHVHLKHENTKEAPSNPVHANLTEFRVDMVKLPLKFPKHTRYAVRVVFFSSGETSHAAQYTTKKYIDDEFTPGNFQMWSVHFPLKFESKYLFSAWKPVSYTKEDRNRETQSLTKNFGIGGVQLKLKGNLDSIDSLESWTMVSDINGMKFYGMNITYGLAKDGCFNLKPYMSWTGMLGYNQSPVDEISTLVYVIIFVGLGAPVVLILAGVFVLLIRKVHLKTKTYQQIN